MSMSGIRAKVEMGATAVITLAAVAMVGLQSRDRPRPASTAAAPFIENWREENESGIRVGPKSAPVVITEFMDLQCPFCARLVPVVDSIMHEYPDEVAVVVQHFPLGGHPQAIPAAIATECADLQGRFDQMFRSILLHRDSLGIKAWRRFAEDAAIPDVRSFEACITRPVDSFPRIEAGSDLGGRTGVRGTPTVWVNGRVTTPHNFISLRDAVSRALSEADSR